MVQTILKGGISDLMSLAIYPRLELVVEDASQFSFLSKYPSRK
jgi:hypothetical protein